MTLEQNQSAIDEILNTTVEITGWTVDECQNFLTALSADSPERLIEVIDEALNIAIKAEATMAGIDLMKRMGRIVDATVKDGELAWRFHPDCIIGKDSAGNRLDVSFKPDAFFMQSK